MESALLSVGTLALNPLSSVTARETNLSITAYCIDASYCYVRCMFQFWTSHFTASVQPNSHFETLCLFLFISHICFALIGHHQVYNFIDKHCCCVVTLLWFFFRFTSNVKRVLNLARVILAASVV
jgi:hypothetical protein